MNYIRPKDFKFIELSGTTDNTADTAKEFRHNQNEVPWKWEAVGGNIYVPLNGLGPNTVDVRSPAQDEEFKIRLYFF